MPADEKVDYLILGGGIAGSVLAARLSEHDPSLSITLIEAGPAAAGNPLTVEPLACMAAHFSPIDWNYTSVPQPALNGRALYQTSAKILGGGSVTNYGAWTRGAKEDYEDWARAVGDRRWSYEGMLPYFRKTESHFREAEGEGFDGNHGYEGPIHLTNPTRSHRKYPLRDTILKGFQRVGVEQYEDMNSGTLGGISELVENFRDGKRQIASDAYGLHQKKNVQIILETMVTRVLIEDGAAIGCELADGRKLYASKEVIVSCGAYRTPQVLILSGIGPADELKRHGIAQHADLPVGQNLSDHFAMYQFWKIIEPERGLSMGTPLWTDATYGHGLPVDWIITSSFPSSSIRDALAKDNDTTHASLADEKRAVSETMVMYAPAGAIFTGFSLPVDGTLMGSLTFAGLPTSRGTVTLSSTDPADPPVVDPNYYTTEVDRVVLRSAVRQVHSVMRKTPELAGVVAEELVPPGVEPLSDTPSDEEIDEHVRKYAAQMMHPACTARMGDVVDTELRVKGIRRLRVVDTSVFPGPLCAHYQAATYAMAEQAAEIIIAAAKVA